MAAWIERSFGSDCLDEWKARQAIDEETGQRRRTTPDCPWNESVPLAVHRPAGQNSKTHHAAPPAGMPLSFDLVRR
jgi:hypothetical protein